MDATACGSLDAANDVCRGGDSVGIMGGSYAPQTISGSGIGRSASSRCSFFTPAGQVAVIGCGTRIADDGVTPTLDFCINVNGSYLNLDGGPQLGIRTQTGTIKGWTYQGRSGSDRGWTDITIDHVDTGAWALDASNMVVEHSDIGPSLDPLNNRIEGGNGNGFTDDLIHDFPVINGGHFECITWESGFNIVIQRNLFKNCGVFDIFAKPVENVGGLVDHNSFWEKLPDGGSGGGYNNDNLAVRTGAGASSCQVTASNNWFMLAALDLSCPGAVDGGGNTYHSNSETPPDPRGS